MTDAAASTDAAAPLTWFHRVEHAARAVLAARGPCGSDRYFHTAGLAALGGLSDAELDDGLVYLVHRRLNDFKFLECLLDDMPQRDCRCRAADAAVDAAADLIVTSIRKRHNTRSAVEHLLRGAIFEAAHEPRLSAVTP